MFRRFAAAPIAAAFVAAAGLASAQSVVQLKNAPPAGATVTLLLTDGTVLAQSYEENTWYKLTPDNTGSYVKGTWAQMASLPAGYVPLYFASAVLSDGRVVIIGGEYNNNEFAFSNLGAVYDPAKNAWTRLAHPRGWRFIGDSPSAVLADGRFMVGEKMHKNLAVLDPKTLKWSALPSTGKNDWNAEEGWTLLPDGSVLTADVLDHPKSERYDIGKQRWVRQGSTVADLWGPQNCCGCIPYGDRGRCYQPPGEIGPAILRPDGSVFATGALDTVPAHTAIWHKPGPLHPGGNWTAGPDFPNGDQAGDTYAVLLPDGNVLIEGDSGTLYEFDGNKLTVENVGTVASYTPLVVLPTGQVLVGGFEVYNPAGTYQSAWQPTITSFPSTVTRGSSYKISGTQFNGLSQAAAFGDEGQLATNYPLVRITNNASGHVFYARTHDHSTMGVATGSKKVSTHFDVPTGMETGASTLEVVANGIPSPSVSVTVQ
ncbi:MAG: hypothetical protein ACREHF_13010 [Rhizomicrobium sp.]